MGRSEGLKAFIERDWALVAEAKRESWLARRGVTSPADALRAADQLRQHAHAVRPDWPTLEERDADLAVHERVAEVLSRARPLHRR